LAKFRTRLMRKGPLPIRYVLLLSLVFFLFSTAAGLWIINKRIEPTLMMYAESQTRKIAALVISKAIKKVDTSGVDAIQIVASSNGKPPIAKLKPDVINRLLAETTTEIQHNLKTAENGDLSSLEQLTDVKIETNPSKNANGIQWYIPIGQVTKSALFGNMGPDIPVRFFAIGDVRPDVKTNFKPLGINNTWIDVSVQVTVSVQIILPFATKVTKLTQTIPVGGTLIQGDVPTYYNGGGSSAPAIQLPDKKN
jgi:sporulation protein YunB